MHGPYMLTTRRASLLFIPAIAFLLMAALPGAAPLFAQAKPLPSAPPEKKPLVTLVELGSVKCVPCKMMQPVMESIGKKYGGQVRIVFHDVWTDSGKTLAEPYRIRAIPTQVFLDQKGVEIFRHEGFYPESEIDKLLQRQGLKVLTAPAK
jgi:thioredoxin 1